MSARLMQIWATNWNAFAYDVLNARLDDAQQEILHAIQTNARVAIRSGHARGKDFVAAVAAVCFFVTRRPSKVLLTAPTDRQVINIMVPEVHRLFKNARQRYSRGLGGLLHAHGVKFNEQSFILGFKAGSTRAEDWTGYHSPNAMVVVTEATGMQDSVFNSIEGLLTGSSRLVLALNPSRTTGRAYEAFQSPAYRCFRLSSLDAPNVIARKTLIPGQVEWEWIRTVIDIPGWTDQIPPPADGAAVPEGDFLFDGRWYRARDLAREKILGLWPLASSSQLIQEAWIDAAQARWHEWRRNSGRLPDGQQLRLGVDIAGMGRDLGVECYRYGPLVERLDFVRNANNMEVAGRVRQILERDGAERAARQCQHNAAAFLDTIGEGAGAHARLEEMEMNSVSAKFSHHARGHMDATGQRTFANMRAYCYWAIRDWLDPDFGRGLMLPDCPYLKQELLAIQVKQPRSDGSILIEEKEAIKEKIGRSPDRADALALTFYPRGGEPVYQENALAGFGIW